MKFVSLFAGIGGFDIALEREGHECVGQCEIDPHATSVLWRHWPFTAKHPDVSTLTSDDFDMPDLVTFGSPCQDLSIAGRRAGLDGERSGLFMQAIRYIRELREASNGQSPEFAIWENVPGAFSSNHGRDFAVVLRALAELGALDIAWRVLDSQWFGVPQRRRRIFLVADFGGERAGEILSLPESLSWDSPQSRTPGEGITGALTGGPSSSNAGNLDDNRAQAGFAIPVAHTETLPTMRAGVAIDGPGKGARSGDTKDEYIVPVAFDWTASPSRSLNPAPVAPAMEAQGKTAVAFAENSRSEIRLEGGDGTRTGALNTGGGKPGQGTPAIAFALRGRENGAMPEMRGDHTNALRGSPGGSSRDYIATPWAVRRLTPRECERLQGFPDDHTRYAHDGTEIADTHRYRMLGNAVTVNVAQHLGRRLPA